jgi:hypothetical protein
MRHRRYKVLQTSNPVLNYVQSNIIASLAVHWVFQGMLYMDRTERLFKMALDVIVVTTFLVTLGLSTHTLIIGFLVGHTLNFVFNGQINGVLKCFGISRASKGDLVRYLDEFARRVNGEPSICYAAAFGSVSRGQIGDSSDIDIRLIRAPGLLSAFRSCVLVMGERTRAFLTGVPLDIFLLDNELGLTKLRPDEPPRILKGLA